MEKELNYLSDKIQQINEEIDAMKFGVSIDWNSKDELKHLEYEKEMLENILNELTNKTLTN